MTPKTLGRYEIIEELGKGAMGLVYLARDPLIGRQLALKTFRLGYSARDEEMHQFKARFLREAQSAGILSHPNIVTIHDVQVEDGGEFFIAMEYVKGTDLKQLMQRRGRLELRFVLDVVAQIADGLEYAHSKGVVHRDIKPANIIITAEKQAKITDFGIARVDASNLTVEGQLLGTPNYMAPEQIRGKEVDHRADLFSLGVMLYEMVTGKKPFAGENLTVVTHRIVYDAFTPPEELTRGLPPALTAILDRALAKEPAERYGRGGDMARDLRSLLAPSAPEATISSFLNDSSVGSASSPSTPAGGTLVGGGQTRIDGLGNQTLPVGPGASGSAGAHPAGANATVVTGATAAGAAPAAGAVESRSQQAVPSPAVAGGARVDPHRARRGGSLDSPDGPAPGPHGVSHPAAAESRDAAHPQPAPGNAAGSTPRGTTSPRSSGRVPVLVGVGLLLLLLLGVVGYAVLRGGGGAVDRPVIDPEAEMRAQSEPLVERGRQAMADGEPVRAIEYFDQALVVLPGDPEIRKLREQAERQLLDGDLTREEAMIRERERRAEEAIASRDWSAAVVAARSILEVDPDSERGAELLAEAEDGQRRREETRARVQDRFTRTVTDSEGASPPSRGAAPVVAAAPATLDIDFQSELSEGIVTVFVDTEKVFKESFRFVVERGGFLRRSKKGSGSLSHTGEVAAGEHKLRVYVYKQGGSTQTQELAGNFPSGSARTLHIQVSREGAVSTRLE